MPDDFPLTRITERVRGLRQAAVRHLRRARSMREAPLPLVDSMEDAMARPAGAVDFPCPVDQCVMENARGFGRARWHPYTETARSILCGETMGYRVSILERYYQIWQPTDAASAVIGLPCSAESLRSVPPHGYYSVPWLDYAPDGAMAMTEAWHVRELSEHGLGPARIEDVGFNGHGPVSETLGAIEFQRIVVLANSIDRHGFNRMGDDGVQVDVLLRGEERRFVNCGGQHRTAVMNALGEAHVPARRRHIVNRDDAAAWPNVRSGLWSLAEALRYFDHLFDFDSRQWALERGLCRGASEAGGPGK
jgi:hypothetical protein